MVYPVIVGAGKRLFGNDVSHSTYLAIIQRTGAV